MFEILLNVFYAVFSIFVSVIYWVKDTNKPSIRFFISLHSILLLLTLIGVMYVGLELKIHNNLYFYSCFLILLLISLISAAYNIACFTGTKLYHLLHLWNLFAFSLTLFIGTMALSNDWL
jgi:hypothetical protein